MEVIPIDYWAYPVLELRRAIIRVKSLFLSYTENEKSILDMLTECIEKGSLWAIIELYPLLSIGHQEYVQKVLDDKTKLTKTKRHELREFISRIKKYHTPEKS